MLWLLGTLGAALVATNVYWWHRTETMRESLITSREWDSDTSGPTCGTEDTDLTDSLLLRRAVAAADVPAEELPDRIKQYDEQVSTLKTDIEKIRHRWAETWWKALERPQFKGETPTVISVTIDGGTTDEARELAKGAIERANAITVVTTENGSFAVGVGDNTSEFITADHIADELVDAAGGGAGGAAQLATGGGSDPESLQEAIANLSESLEFQR